MKEKNIDYKLFFAVMILVIFGMIMISSVSVYSSYKVTSKQVIAGLIAEPYNYYYVKENITHVIAGSILLAILTKIKYNIWERLAPFLFGIGLILLMYVLTFDPIKGARGWISLPAFTIQPTEFVKLALIVLLASYFKKYAEYLKEVKGFLPFVGIMGILVILIGLQPDFGTLMVITPLSVIMYFYAGMNLKHLVAAMILGFSLIVGVYFIGDYDKQTGKNTNSFGYITKRIDTYLGKVELTVEKAKAAEHQTTQGLISMGSGGFTGIGFGKSIQKHGYLPEVQGDFIFAVIVEELGFLGGFCLLLLYMYIGYRGLYIANRVKESFGKYVAVGISSWIVLQAFINIGVTLKVVPLTGITLPFVSYGGSSLLSLMIAVGILLSISRHIEEKKRFSRQIDKKKILLG